MTAREIMDAFFDNDDDTGVRISEDDLWRAAPDAELLPLAIHLGVMEMLCAQAKNPELSNEQCARLATDSMNEKIRAECHRRKHARDGMPDICESVSEYAVQRAMSGLKLARVRKRIRERVAV